MLAGTNTYTGPTAINSGTLQLGDGTLSGALGNTAITNNAALVLNPGATSATILASLGSHTVASSIALASDLAVTVSTVADTLTLSGGVSGTGKSLTKAGPGTLVLGGTNSYTGTTTVAGGTLAIANSLFGAGGAITLADGTTLAASGAIQRSIAVSGANQTGTITAVGNLTIVQLGGGITFDGHLNTQGNLVHYSTSGDTLVRTISMGNGATLTSGTAIKLANNLGGSSQGDTGVAYIDGSTTIGGTFWAGRVTNDSSLFIGAGSNPNGDKVTFTGILRGSLTNAGVDVVVEGLDRQGWSPAFGATTGANFSPTGTVVFSANNTNQYTPNVGTWPPSAPAASGGHSQRLVAGYIQNSIPRAGTYTATATTTYQWNADSTYNPATAVKGDTFTLVRTDGSAWGQQGTVPTGHTNTDGSVIGFAFITLPNGTAGGSNGSFQNLPFLTTPGQFWHVDSNVKRIALYVGGFLPFGSGVWKNGAGNQNWTVNTAADNNWGTAQPFWAGHVATFDATVVNYAGGVVNVDAPQMLGGMVFNKVGGGYTVGGSMLTLDNGAGNATIQVLLGSHTVAAPMTLTSNLLVTVDSAADLLNVSGPIGGLNRTLTKAGPGTLVLSGTSTYTGTTTVTGGTLGGTGTLASSVVVTGGRVRGDIGTGIGTLTVAGLSVASTGAIAANLGASETNSKFALGGGILNLATNSTLHLTALPGFGTTPASYTLGSNGILQLDGNAVPDAFPYGTYTQGVGAAGPVVIDVSQFGFALAPGDQFTLSRSGSDLLLTFTSPIPEPALLILAGTALVGLLRRRNRTTA